MKVKDLVSLYDGDIKIDLELAPQVWDQGNEKEDCIQHHGDDEVKGFSMDIYTDDEDAIHSILEIRLWEGEAK